MHIVSLLFFAILVISAQGSIGPNSSGRTTRSERTIADCQKWYNVEPDPAPLLAKIRKCPCSIPTSFPKEYNDGGAKWKTDDGCQAAQQPNTCSYHKGAHGCYRHAYGSSGPGTQCCYNKAGIWISDPFQGAGTLDRECAPTNILNIFQWLAHNKHDVIPWDDCCKDPAMPREICQLYYEKRPPGECVNYSF